MATNFSAMWQQLIHETRTLLPDISDYSILVTNSNTDPNNPATNSIEGYRIIEHLNGGGYNALSHEVYDYNGSSVIKGDVGGHTFVNEGLKSGEEPRWGNDGPLVLTADYTYKGAIRSNVDIVHARGGNDVVYGYTGNDKLYGGDGHDILFGGTGNDLLNGGSGIDFLLGGEGNDRLEGGTGDDYLNGEEGADELYGGDGDDYLIGGPGADRLEGGDGTDSASYLTAAGPVVVNLEAPTENTGDAAGDWYDSIEGIIGSPNPDTLTGDQGNNLIEGGAGADTLNGGDGFDTLVYSSSPAGVVVSLAQQAASGGDAQGDTFMGFEAVTGSSYNDILTGDAGNNTLSGGAGMDVLTGGAGADTLNGDSGIDFANYNTSPAAVAIDLANNTASGGDAQGDVLNGIEGIIGSAHDDTLKGDSENNTFFGGKGNDSIYGGEGDDLINGGAGADELYGGAGIDRLDYGTSPAGVIINLANGGSNGGDAEGDSISGFEQVSGSQHNDTLAGDDNNNTLFGEGGNDNIFGGAGDDAIFGGTGNDMMAGEAGNDMLLGGAGDDYYLFGDGSQVDTVVEQAGEGTDIVYFTNIGTGDISVYKSGNDLLIAANNAADILKIQNWYQEDGTYTVEGFYFAEEDKYYTDVQIAGIAVELPQDTGA